MSAICGIVNRQQQPANPKVFDPVMAQLSAYGHDGCHQEQLGSVIFGHQMLYLTPESVGAVLPWQDPVSGLLITADARLDNRSELCTKLEIPPQIGRDLSDERLILKAYRKWGDACPKHLRGDFAFAIWNEQTQTLFCARDIMGVRPFYYHPSATQFIFATDINAVLAAPGVTKDFFEPMIAAYLQAHDLTWAEKSYTFFKDVVKLPPAHSLTVTPARLTTCCYWAPEQVTPLLLGSEQDYIDTLRELLTEAVTCRLRCAYPIGAHMSGGLDSSAVAVLAARQLHAQGKSLTAFSWSPPLTETIDLEGKQDERQLIERMCQQEHIQREYVEMTAASFVEGKTRNFMTTPSTMLFREKHVQAAAGQHRMRLLLSGWGGDEAVTFNARGYLGELFLQGRWPTIWQRVYQSSRTHGFTPLISFAATLRNELLPDWLYERWLARKSPFYQPPDRSQYIQPAFAKRNRDAMQPLLQPLLRTRPGVHNNQIALLNHGHITQRIESWAISGAQRGLVYSYPLLDQRLLEFALAIPSECSYSSKDSWKRYLFRTGTAGILPDSVRWKKDKYDNALLANQDKISPELLQLFKSHIQTGIEAASQLDSCQAYMNIARLNLDMAKISQYLGREQKEPPGFYPAIQLATIMGQEALSAQNREAQIETIV